MTIRLRIGLAFALGLICPALGAEDIAVAPATRTWQIYRAAKADYFQNTNQARLAWTFGRSCFDWAEFASNNTQRAAIARDGIAACQRAIALESTNGAAHYYLGLNLGQLARTKRMSALHLLDEMESALLVAIRLDPGFDFAGADRSVGLLYKEAPGWPLSLGSRNKARIHLQRAVTLAPDYPDNQLSLLEAFWEWGDRSKVQSAVSKTEVILRAAHDRLNGAQWVTSWQDWDARWQALKKRANSGEPEPRRTPRP